MSSEVMQSPDALKRRAERSEPHAGLQKQKPGPSRAHSAGIDTAGALQSSDVGDQISDETLICGIKGGSNDALGALFHRHANLVRSVALRLLQDRAEADDLVQEVFLFVFRKASLFDPNRGTGRSWLLQITYHRAFDRRRYLKSRHFYTNLEIHECVLDTGEPPAPASSYEQAIEAALGRSAISRIEESLTEVQRSVIQLHFGEGNTLQEVAGILGQTVGNVRNHYYRALEKMRREVFDEKLREK